MIERQNGDPEGNELFMGLPARLFDGYDGEGKASEAMVAQLLEGAPPELKARIEEWANQRAALEAEDGAQSRHNEPDGQ